MIFKVVLEIRINSFKLLKFDLTSVTFYITYFRKHIENSMYFTVIPNYHYAICILSTLNTNTLLLKASFPSLNIVNAGRGNVRVQWTATRILINIKRPHDPNHATHMPQLLNGWVKNIYDMTTEG